VRAFGAGLLSSFGELQYCLGDEPKKLPFDPNVAAVTKYPITSYQPLYFVTESFEHAKKQMREYADTLSRPFDVRYDPLTQTVEVFDSVSSIMPFAKRLSSEMGLLTDALEKLANK
jgi:phenylalanine-4-hydroxylase